MLVQAHHGIVVSCFAWLLLIVLPVVVPVFWLV